ncbi:MAG: hydroxymethylglutaryl-CoA reductase, degradative [Bacteroidota bacterium]
MKPVSGFSKMSKRKKLRWVVENFFRNPEEVTSELMSFWHGDENQQKVFDEFSENTLSNYFLPFGVAPNFIVNGQTYCVPMVIEESSVVAAASSGAKFWMERGGFKAKIIGTKKAGQVHFTWKGDAQKLKKAFPELKQYLLDGTNAITANMQKRGGGILDITLVDMTHLESDYFQLDADFETCDSMGANFINSVLEEFAKILKAFAISYPGFEGEEKEVNVIMSILSNYTPECLVRSWVECPVEQFVKPNSDASAEKLVAKFEKAIRIAHVDVSRATTHNKGIFNGIDAVALATGNDFRAIEACGHAYAARTGQYKSLSNVEVKDGMFRFWIDFPIAVGTVGGLTALHPLAKRSLEMLGNPGAQELMQIMVSVGLAQNFAAVRSLITTGIQKGHMRMHLMNILNHMGASEKEVSAALEFFKEKVVSFTAVREFLDLLRNGNASGNNKLVFNNK